MTQACTCTQNFEWALKTKDCAQNTNSCSQSENQFTSLIEGLDVKTSCRETFMKTCFRSVYLYLRGYRVWFPSDPRRGGSRGTIGWIAPPKTYENNFVRHDFVQFGKQHWRYKDIFPSLALSKQCCEVYFISLTVVNT